MNPWYHPPANRNRRNPHDYRHDNITRYIEHFNTHQEWNPRVLFDAAVLGRDDVIRFALDNGCPFDQEEQSLSYGALYGNLNCVELLHSRGCRITSQTCEFAAQSHSLSCLEYILNNGGELTSSVFTQALIAHNPNIAIFQLLISKRCPVDTNTIAEAIRWKQFDVIELLVKNQYTVQIEPYLQDLNKLVSDIPFENSFWQEFLFECDLASFPKLQEKKLEYEDKYQLAKFQTNTYRVISKLVLDQHLSNDIVPYILFSYF